MEATFFYKYGNIYREVLNIPRYNFCRLTMDFSNNILLSMILKLGRESAPGAIHLCPYSVNFLSIT